MVMWFPCRRPLLFLLYVWAMLGIACGGDGAPDRTGNPGPSTGPRLEWDQPADSLQQAQSFAFQLYVDEVPRPLAGVQCRSGSGGTSYICAAALPQLGAGRHILQLAAVQNGIEGSLSDPLVVSGDGGQLTINQQSDPSPAPAVSCTTSPVQECYDVRLVAENLDNVSALTPSPDGRLFFVEGGTRVRVAVEGALVQEAALTLAEDGARIIALAVDPTSGPENKSVFVAWTELTQPDRATLNVTRYRDVGNVLGEGATILTGIPVPVDGATSLAVDGEGHLFVAVPALDPSAPSGVVLRLTRDGRVPPENRLGLPAFTPGFSTPSSLSLDSNQRLMWLAGRNSGQDYAISVVPVAPADTPQLPSVVAQVTSDEPVSFVLVRGDRAAQPEMFVLANGLLSKVLRASDGSFAGYAPLPLNQIKLETAAATPAGSMYVATQTSVFALVRR